MVIYLTSKPGKIAGCLKQYDRQQAGNTLENEWETEQEDHISVFWGILLNLQSSVKKRRKI